MSRADGRTADLRVRILDRLRDRVSLTDELANAPGIDDGSDAIVPAFVANREFDPDEDTDPPGVRVAVSLVTESSTRENHAEEKSMTVQAVVNIRGGVLGSVHDGSLLNIAWHDRIVDEIAGELTTHDPPWRAGGQTGGTPEPLWDADNNRYRSPLRFDIGRRD